MLIFRNTCPTKIQSIFEYVRHSVKATLNIQRTKMRLQAPSLGKGEPPKAEVDYLPDNGGPIIKNGHSKMVPATSATPPVAGFSSDMPHTNIRRTRSRVRLAVWISMISMVMVLAFFCMGIYWLWSIESRELHQDEEMDEIQRIFAEKLLELESLKKMVETNRNIPLSQDDCSLPADIGPCGNSVERWFFDSDSGLCKIFYYGGCHGNSNNFKSRSDCEKQCTNSKTVPENPCDMPKKVGACRASIERFYYDKESGDCQSFFFGGCDGNSNNFETLEKCRQKCKLHPDCQLPPLIGKCRGALPSYFFNKDSKQCEMFEWGGCEGNNNRFDTKESCQKKCQGSGVNTEGETPLSKEEVCKLPPEMGSCRGELRRFYFNHEKRVCEEFSYGGCDGNANNFESDYQCSNFCKDKLIY